MKSSVHPGLLFPLTENSSISVFKLTLGLTSRAVVVTEDAVRLVDVVESRFGPAAAVDGALVVVVFLSEVVEVVMEDVGRLVVTVPPAVALLGRVLVAAVSLVAPTAGCDAGGTEG